LPVPTATPGNGSTTPAESQDQALAGNIPPTISGLKVSDLPLVNGLPKIPLTNLAAAPAVPTPARKANYGANGQPKIGVQAGHWMIDQLPDMLASLRSQTGGSGGGVREVDYVLDIARRVQANLQAAGYEVDLLPATVPADYTADAFVAIHADASTSGSPSGYKLARSRFSPIPSTDDALLNAVSSVYGPATGFRWDDNITRNMSGYYAFNSRRRVYAVSKGTPAIIIETGYLTNAADRNYLVNHKDVVANGIAQGIINFINTRPPLDRREKPSSTTPGVAVSQDNTPVYDQPGGKPVAYLSKDQRFEVYEVRDDYYTVFLPYLNKAAYLRRTDATTTTVPR
jgi:N-acetylmuramoyl-L-alanine amidase